MDELITKQIVELQQLQNKASKSYGDYVDINVAIAALQVCNHYGLNETSRIISNLKLSPLNIASNDKLNDVLKKCSNFIISAKVKNIEDDKFICPSCNNELKSNEFKYCPYCGQNLYYEVNINHESDDK